MSKITQEFDITVILSILNKIYFTDRNEVFAAIDFLSNDTDNLQTAWITAQNNILHTYPQLANSKFKASLDTELEDLCAFIKNQRKIFGSSLEFNEPTDIISRKLKR